MPSRRGHFMPNTRNRKPLGCRIETMSAAKRCRSTCTQSSSVRAHRRTDDRSDAPRKAAGTGDPRVEIPRRTPPGWVSLDAEPPPPRGRADIMPPAHRSAAHPRHQCQAADHHAKIAKPHAIADREDDKGPHQVKLFFHRKRPEMPQKQSWHPLDAPAR